MGELIAVDVFKTDHKLPHIMRYIDVPKEYSLPVPSDSEFFPRVKQRMHFCIVLN